MMWEETSYTIPLIVATAALVMSALYLWLRSLLPGAKTGALLLLSGTAWMVGFAVEVLSADISIKVLGDKIQFQAMVAVPVIWLVYILQCTGVRSFFLVFFCSFKLSSALIISTMNRADP